MVFRLTWGVLKLEVISQMRQPFQWLTPLLFFILVISLFCITLHHTPETLSKAGAVIIWVSILLAVIISMGDLFSWEQHEHLITLVIHSQTPLTYYVMIKIICHWMMTSLPLILMTPFLVYIMGIPYSQLPILLATLIIGTPVLSLIGAIGAGLASQLANQGLLLPLIIIPLYIPTLIISIGTLYAAELGLMVSGQLALLGALFFISAIVCPFFTSLALRIGVSH